MSFGMSSSPTPVLKQGPAVLRTGHRDLGWPRKCWMEGKRSPVKYSGLPLAFTCRTGSKFPDPQPSALLGHVLHAHSGSVLRIQVFCQFSVCSQWAVTSHTCSLCCIWCDLMPHVLLYCMVGKAWLIVDSIAAISSACSQSWSLLSSQLLAKGFYQMNVSDCDSLLTPCPFLNLSLIKKDITL